MLIEMVCPQQFPTSMQQKHKLSENNWSDALSKAREMAAYFDEKKIEKPFTIVDLSIVRRQVYLWKKYIPSVKPFYAVKCNDDPKILRTLLDQGCGFDCASLKELEQILALSPSADIVLAHPIKTRECIRYSSINGVDRMTFDSMPELLKMVECAPKLRPILRIKVRGFNALVNLNTKYGAEEQTAEYILRCAAEMKISIAGISFHIGSGVEDYRPLTRALSQTRNLLDFGRKLGHPMEIVDIGGGIIYSNERDFAELGFFLEQAIDFNLRDQNVTIIAEPGRFLVNNCQFAVAKVLQVFPKSIQEDQEPEYNVFINDGVYGSFNYVMTEHREARGIPLMKRRGTMKADIWGPTCCSFDVVEKNRKISTLHEGDWLIYPNNGAYSNVLSTEFNGFEQPERIYINQTA